MAEFQPVNLATIHALVSPSVRQILSPDGFEEVGILRWVRSVDAPIRQVFSLFQWKGGMTSPSWGVSLDFVPHISGGSVKWHRTAKSAMLDLRVDSRDPTLDIPHHRGPEPIHSAAPLVVQKAVANAREFWNRARREADLLDVFSWLKAYYPQWNGLGFYNFVQHPLALAFVYARKGLRVEAEAELEKCRPLPDDELFAQLRMLLDKSAKAA